MARQTRSDDRTRNPWRPKVGDDDAAVLVVVKRGEKPNVAMMKGPTDLLAEVLATMQPARRRRRRKAKADA